MKSQPQDTSNKGSGKYNEHCPNCGKYIERNADGFYDREHRDNECSIVLQFCNEECANKFHNKRNPHFVKIDDVELDKQWRSGEAMVQLHKPTAQQPAPETSAAARQPAQATKVLRALHESRGNVSTPRIYDLIRYCRSELHQAKLITDEEYAQLAETGSESARRLEQWDYAELDRVKQQLEQEKSKRVEDHPIYKLCDSERKLGWERAQHFQASEAKLLAALKASGRLVISAQNVPDRIHCGNVPDRIHLDKAISLLKDIATEQIRGATQKQLRKMLVDAIADLERKQWLAPTAAAIAAVEEGTSSAAACRHFCGLVDGYCCDCDTQVMPFRRIEEVK